jgi:hypothetical protein
MYFALPLGVDKLSALHFDSSDHEMRADDKPICNTNSSYKTSEDSNQSDGDDTIENKSLVHDGNLTSIIRTRSLSLLTPMAHVRYQDCSCEGCILVMPR